MTTTLLSSDGREFPAEAVALLTRLSGTIRNLTDAVDSDEAAAIIPLPNVDGKTLDRVLEYCAHLADSSAASLPAPTPQLDEWSAAFLDLPNAELFDLLLAANYLDIRALLDAACSKVALMIKGKTTEEIRVAFDIKNDFTPEEEEAVRRENLWAFDDSSADDAAHAPSSRKP